MHSSSSSASTQSIEIRLLCRAVSLSQRELRHNCRLVYAVVKLPSPATALFIALSEFVIHVVCNDSVISETTAALVAGCTSMTFGAGGCANAVPLSCSVCVSNEHRESKPCGDGGCPLFSSHSSAFLFQFSNYVCPWFYICTFCLVPVFDSSLPYSPFPFSLVLAPHSAFPSSPRLCCHPYSIIQECFRSSSVTTTHHLELLPIDEQCLVWARLAAM